MEAKTLPTKTTALKFEANRLFAQNATVAFCAVAFLLLNQILIDKDIVLRPHCYRY